MTPAPKTEPPYENRQNPKRVLPYLSCVAGLGETGPTKTHACRDRKGPDLK